MLRSLMCRLLRPVLRTLARLLFRIEASAQAIDFIIRGCSWLPIINRFRRLVARPVSADQSSS